MKRSIKLFLEDIIEYIELIEKSMEGCEKSKFLKDRDLQDATVRRLEIIGEATKNIPRNFRENYKMIEWKKIAGLRDIIIHAYFKVDLDIVWNIVKKNLPDLKKQIKEILEKEK